MSSVSIDNVNKVFGTSKGNGVHAVRDLSMGIDDGEIIALLGSSGCGKSSTLRMIAGFETVTDGEIRVGERLINRLPPAERNVAMAFEAYALYPPLTVEKNIAFALVRNREPRSVVDRKVREIAERLEITDILERYPAGLSGGQQQRVSLARALIRPAELYLLDEPMSQLEPQLRATLRGRIKEYLLEHRLTTVFVTHDQTEAIALADRIAVMDGGVLQQFGTPKALEDRPANLFVASFIGEPPMNLLSGRVAESADGLAIDIDSEGADEPACLKFPDSPETRRMGEGLAPGQGVTVGIRAHRMTVGADDPAGGAAGRLTAEVTSNQWLGDQSHLGLSLNGKRIFAVSRLPLDVRLSDRVTLSWPVAHLHVFDAGSTRALFHGGDPAGEEVPRG
ncbi:ABC transporter ATP-binding protein [Arhodomonas sp. AD133]|uniref:ABC transporter ATP-binding protein n=1 Tax=Arhodomonas sp. AD133 TaxID=3415009 RepID=UPI003EBCF9B6